MSIKSDRWIRRMVEQEQTNSMVVMATTSSPGEMTEIFCLAKAEMTLWMAALETGVGAESVCAAPGAAFTTGACDGSASEAVGVLQLEKVCDFTDYFVICSGSNRRQVEAIADRVADQLKDEGVSPLHVEGVGRGRWILMDYGDFLVHVLDTERRDYYRLEDLWSDAPDVTPGFVDPVACQS